MKKFTKECLKKFVVDYLFLNNKIDIYDVDVFEKIMSKKEISETSVNFTLKPSENGYEKEIIFSFVKEEETYKYIGYSLN
ncbi:MAG: hypothetical protein ACRC5T_04975 [Cetobacterium sp.]